MSQQHSAVPLEQIPEAVASLRKVFSTGRTRDLSWRRNQLLRLKTLLAEGSDQICQAVRADLHKHPYETYVTELNIIESEIQTALEHLEEWAEPAVVSTNFTNLPGLSYVKADPMGVALLLSPWNYPVNLLFCPLVGAIAAGNCVLMRPGNYTTNTSEAIAQLVHRYLDRDAIKIALGDRSMTSAVLSQRFDTIFFTGGVMVGKMVATAAANFLTPVTLELGGKSPCIIDRTADIQIAAARVAWGAFMNSGQTCVRPDYLFVHQEVANRFYTELRKRVEGMYGVNPKESDDFGRIINVRAHQRIAQLLKDSQKHVIFGGDVDEKDKYIAPTLLDFDNEAEFDQAPVMSEEIFGPLLPSLRFSNLDDVINYINRKDKPLALYVFSSSSQFTDRLLNETSSGGFNVNDVCMHLANHELPFGGVGASGMGSYHGKKSFDAFSHQKAVLYKTNFFDLPLRYAPYTPQKDYLFRILGKARPAWQRHILTTAFWLVSSLAGVYSYGLKYLDPLLAELHKFKKFFVFVFFVYLFWLVRRA